MRGLILVFVLGAGTAHAHPDHPSGLIGLAHMLTEPDHLAMLLIPVLIVAGVWLYRRSRKR